MWVVIEARERGFLVKSDLLASAIGRDSLKFSVAGVETHLGIEIHMFIDV